jgi:HAD superfamily hydrolase (TIGR01459 family)
MPVVVPKIPGVRALVSEFDDFLVDLWGVVHDGARPYDGVVEALEALVGKRVLFVTNTSRLRDAVIDTLVGQMGIERRLFVDVVSSGDVTRAALLARDPAVFDGLPSAPRCFHHGNASFVPWLFESSLGLEMIDDVARADLVIATGAPRDAPALEAARTLLAPAAARRVRLVCTNPDRVIPTGRGRDGTGRDRVASIGPGAVADVYAELGGPVFLYGKPHAPIYEEARRRIGGAPARRIVAIGDRLETDIRGARAAGLASVHVAHGDPGATDDGSESVAPDIPDMRMDSFAW